VRPRKHGRLKSWENRPKGVKNDTKAFGLG
jgi:hypothetical protein